MSLSSLANLSETDNFLRFLGFAIFFGNFYKKVLHKKRNFQLGFIFLRLFLFIVLRIFGLDSWIFPNLFEDVKKISIFLMFFDIFFIKGHFYGII